VKFHYFFRKSQNCRDNVVWQRKVLFKVQNIRVRQKQCSLKVVVSTIPQGCLLLRSLRLHIIVCQAEHRMLHATWNLCKTLKHSTFVSGASCSHVCGHFWYLWTENVWAMSLGCCPVVLLQLLVQLTLDRVGTFTSSVSWSFLSPCCFHKVWYASLKHLVWMFDNERVMNITNTVLCSISNR